MLLFSVKYEYICFSSLDDGVERYQGAKKWSTQLHIDLFMNTESLRYAGQCL